MNTVTAELEVNNGSDNSVHEDHTITGLVKQRGCVCRAQGGWFMIGGL